MIGQYYRAVEINIEGNSVEPVNYVGVHPLKWMDSQPPDMGFVECGTDMEELRNILNGINYKIETAREFNCADQSYLKQLCNDISDFITKFEGL